VVENVASGARKWVDAVCRALARDGYACLPIPIAARYVGAKHRRARVFIIAAHANSSIVRFEQGGGGGSRWKDSLVASGDCWRAAEPKMVRVVHGLSGRLDKPSSRRKALGNAVVPKCGEVVGHVIKRLCS
jgi:site-specific DNA-cytosine methylase